MNTFLLRLTIVSLSLFGFVLLSSSPKPATAQVWTGGQCNFDNQAGNGGMTCCNNASHISGRTGWTDVSGPGTCINVDVQSCPNGTVVPSNIWLCPGGNNIRCCAPRSPTYCGNSSAPSGTIISQGIAKPRTSANYSVNNEGDKAVDGSNATSWNAGAGPTQWIEIDLGGNRTINGLRLNVLQSPNGGTIHQIFAGASMNPTTSVRTLSCMTSNSQNINVNFSPALTNTRYIRISTTSGPSWVAWNEITVYGPTISSPTPTPTATGTPTPTPTRFNQSTTTPGIIFTGNGTGSFGLGQASVRNWVAGGLTYSEVYTRTGPSTISYQYLLNKIQNNNITINPISDYCTTTNCSLPSNLTRGVYHTTGSLNLNAATFSGGNNYVFLVGNDLTLRGNITVANGTTVFFAANRDIIVPASVGAPTNTYPLPNAQIQGLFIANRNFTVQGINNCVTGPDRMLNVEGAIVTNASGTGGTFTNNRDLCGDNLRYPSFTIRSRIDMLFNLPPVLMQQKTTIREDAP